MNASTKALIPVVQLSDHEQEVQRALQICNACRYCESFCAVFAAGIEIQHEYLTAAPLAGLSPEQIYTAQENGLKIAFLTDQEKDELRQKYQ